MDKRAMTGCEGTVRLPVFDIERYPAVLFDFDGTLANTGAAVMRIVRKVTAARGIEATDEQLRAMIGPPLVVGFRDVFGRSPAEAEELTAAYRAVFAREVTPADYPPLPGVTDLLDALRGQGRRLAVATSRKHASAVEMRATSAASTCAATSSRVLPWACSTRRPTITAAWIC